MLKLKGISDFSIKRINDFGTYIMFRHIGGSKESFEVAARLLTFTPLLRDMQNFNYSLIANSASRIENE